MSVSQDILHMLLSVFIHPVLNMVERHGVELCCSKAAEIEAVATEDLQQTDFFVIFRSH